MANSLSENEGLTISEDAPDRARCLTEARLHEVPIFASFGDIEYREDRTTCHKQRGVR